MIGGDEVTDVAVPLVMLTNEMLAVDGTSTFVTDTVQFSDCCEAVSRL